MWCKSLLTIILTFQIFPRNLRTGVFTWLDDFISSGFPSKDSIWVWLFLVLVHMSEQRAGLGTQCQCCLHFFWWYSYNCCLFVQFGNIPHENVKFLFRPSDLAAHRCQLLILIRLIHLACKNYTGLQIIILDIMVYGFSWPFIEDQIRWAQLSCYLHFRF